MFQRTKSHISHESVCSLFYWDINCWKSKSWKFLLNISVNAVLTRSLISGLNSRKPGGQAKFITLSKILSEKENLRGGKFIMNLFNVLITHYSSSTQQVRYVKFHFLTSLHVNVNFQRCIVMFGAFHRSWTSTNCRCLYKIE